MGSLVVLLFIAMQWSISIIQLTAKNIICNYIFYFFLKLLPPYPNELTKIVFHCLNNLHLQILNWICLLWVYQMFTKQKMYRLISDDVEFGGPSPLTAAFFLSIGALDNGASEWYVILSLPVKGFRSASHFLKNCSDHVIFTIVKKSISFQLVRTYWLKPIALLQKY